MKKQQEKSSLGKFMLKLFMILAVFYVGMVMYSQKKVQTDREFQETNNFWATKMWPVVKAVQEGGSQIKELNERNKLLSEQIKKKYGRLPDFIARTSMVTEDAGGLAFSRTRDGIPELTIVIPLFKKMYDSFEEKNRESQFQILVAVALLHEMDHLAGGWGLEIRKYKPEERLDAEANAWSQTCEYTIDPLFKLNIPLDTTCLYFYNGWISNGRKNDQNWRIFLEKIYSPVLGKDIDLSH